MAENTAPQPGDIFNLLSQVMTAIKPVGKDNVPKSGPQFNYRSIDDIQNAAHDAMCEAGIFIVPRVVEINHYDAITELTVEHTFYAPDGSCVVAVSPGQGMDSRDKSTNIGMTAALKVSMGTVFNLHTKDTMIDPEINSTPAPNTRTNADGVGGQGETPATGDAAFHAAWADVKAAAGTMTSQQVDAAIRDKYGKEPDDLTTAQIVLFAKHLTNS